jgi:hypothetical protein
MKLSPAMWKALGRLNNGASTSPGSYRTMEALRRRGLAARYTNFSIRAEYVEKDSVTVQWARPARKPFLLHEWYDTPAGRAAYASHVGGGA